MKYAVIEAMAAISETEAVIANVSISDNAKVAAIVAAATTAAIENGGDLNDLVSAAHRIINAGSSDLLKEVRRQIDALVGTAKAS